MLKIACCLKSGGDFDWDYVDKLYDNITTLIDCEFEFVVFTDKTDRKSSDDIRIELLMTDLKSYWSKLEVFKLIGQVIYFDLDVILMYGLDDFFKSVQHSPYRSISKKHFYMMDAFNKNHKFNSSIMAWNGNFSYLLEGINRKTLDKYGKWDQDYISDTVSKTNEIISVNDFIAIASYKHHCKDGVHPLVDIVVFHGKPRPRDIDWNLNC